MDSPADFSAVLADFGAVVRRPPEPDGTILRYRGKGDKPSTLNI